MASPDPTQVGPLYDSAHALLQQYRDEGVTDFAVIENEIRAFDREDGRVADEQMIATLRSAWEMNL